MREWSRKKKRRKGLTERELKEHELEQFVLLALDCEDPRLQHQAEELAERYGIEGPNPLANRAPGRRFQELLNKYASSE